MLLKKEGIVDSECSPKPSLFLADFLNLNMWSSFLVTLETVEAKFLIALVHKSF